MESEADSEHREESADARVGPIGESVSSNAQKQRNCLGWTILWSSKGPAGRLLGAQPLGLAGRCDEMICRTRLWCSAASQQREQIFQFIKEFSKSLFFEKLNADSSNHISLNSQDIANRTKGVIENILISSCRALKMKETFPKSVCGPSTTSSFFCKKLILNGFNQIHRCTWLTPIICPSMILFIQEFVKKLITENDENTFFQTLQGVSHTLYIQMIKMKLFKRLKYWIGLTVRILVRLEQKY